MESPDAYHAAPGFVQVDGVWQPEDYEPTEWELPAPPVDDAAGAVRELERCEASLSYFVLHHCYSMHVDDPVHPNAWRKFPAYDYIRSFLQAVQVPRNTHVEKTRQMLLSWLWMSVFLWDILFHRNWANLALSHKQSEVDDSGHIYTSLLGKIYHIWLTLPPYLQAPLEFKHMMVRNTELNSFVRGETAGSKNAGHGPAVQRALLDEAARAEHGESIFTGLVQASKSGLILNSTANGKGNVFARIRFDPLAPFLKISVHWTEHPDKAAGLYCTCGWGSEAASEVPPRFQFRAHACGNVLKEPPGRPEPRSPWYDLQASKMTPEQMASQVDISYESSRSGRCFSAYDSTRLVVAHQRMGKLGERLVSETADDYRRRYLRAALVPGKPTVVGWDFGVSDPTSLVFGQVMDEESMHILWLDEFEKRDKSWDYYYTFVMSLWQPIAKEVTKRDILHYGDPSGKGRWPVRIAGSSAGEGELMSWVKNLRAQTPPIIITYSPKRGQRLDWIDFINNIMRKGHIEVSSYASHLNDGLNNYHFPTDRDTGEPIPGQHDPEHDEWSHACLVAGTMVTTSEGQKPIEDVLVGDLVWTRAGYRRVTASGISGHHREVLSVLFSDGRTLVGTGDHPVWVNGKGFTSIALLTYRDAVCAIPSGETSWFSTAARLSDTRTVQVGPCSVTIEQGDTPESQPFTVKCGNTHTALFRKASTSITRITTRWITQSRIWRRFRTALTRGSMSQTVWRSGVHGRCRLKGDFSIASDLLPSMLGLSERRFAQGVDVVANLIGHSALGFALHPVTSAGAASKGLTTRLGLVRSAASLSPSINTSARATAQGRVRQASEGCLSVVSVNSVEQLSTVYDLTVDDRHEFFANGVLVKNCDAFRYVYSFRFAHRLGDIDRRVASTHDILFAKDDSPKAAPPPFDSATLVSPDGKPPKLKYF